MARIECSLSIPLATRPRKREPLRPRPFADRVTGNVVPLVRGPHASDVHAHPAIVVTSSDENFSPESFRVLIDELLASPEP
jgi:hypothetical protein